MMDKDVGVFQNISGDVDIGKGVKCLQMGIVRRLFFTLLAL